MDDQSPPIGDLYSAREILRRSIEQSRNVSIAVDEIGSRLDLAASNLAGLHGAMKNVACKCAVYGIRDQIGRAIGPAAGLVRVLDLVHELEGAVEAGPRNVGVFVYLANIKRLEDALKLLADNCGLLIVWLEDVVHVLKNNEDWYFARLSRILEVLVEVKEKGDSSRREGGVLFSALSNLEREFRRLLTGVSIEDDSSIQELQAIVEVLAGKNRLNNCLLIHAEVRIGNVRANLCGLKLDYLEIELSEAVSVQTVEGYVDEWDKHTEFAVRHLLQKEYRLCDEVYKKFGSDVWLHCFAEIVMRCGFTEIFEFGTAVCRCKKEAIKLLNLIKIFSTLDKLRFDFNDLFCGKYCVNIQNQTRDLVKKVVDGACEIFWELLLQVELQRESSPPADGRIPNLVHFVSQYCNQLLNYENSSILVSILEIYQVWNGVKFGDGLLPNEIRGIVKSLEINLEIWAKGYDEMTLSYLFMMNNHWYLSNKIRGTNLGELMGNSWLWAYEESAEYYAKLYMRESWEKLLVFLHEEDLILFPGGSAVDRSLVKSRIAAFCKAFDDMYKKQSKWTVSDKGLRWKTCQMVVETVVEPYRSYLQKFMMLGVENEDELTNYVKYTPERLENLIGSLFQQRIGKYGSSKCMEMIGINNAAVNHFSSTPAAA